MPINFIMLLFFFLIRNYFLYMNILIVFDMASDKIKINLSFLMFIYIHFLLLFIIVFLFHIDIL